jgi:adenylate cyclase class IV
LRQDFERIREYFIQDLGADKKGIKVFFDQFLDTPSYHLLRRGASLRLRYKEDCSDIYLQYKGPGFVKGNILFRSEFSYRNHHLIVKESKSEVIRFTTTKIQQIIYSRKNKEMVEAMMTHLGESVVNRITSCPIITQYRKEKFLVHADHGFLEPSLDRCFTFFIREIGIHPIGVFCELETEIKAENESLKDKMEDFDFLKKFDEKIADKFNLRPERIDKYARCTKFFLNQDLKKRA